MNFYNLDPHIAEIYDQSETNTDDIDLLRRLVTTQSSCAWRILEPFCGTGRILLPLAQDGHTLTGLDQAHSMLDRLGQKLAALPDDVRRRVAVAAVDVLRAPWPSGFDLVILGGNCLYEFGDPLDQREIIRLAAAAVRPGGFVYVDNDHMEGPLNPAWLQPSIQPAFPTGHCVDGTRVESTWEIVWYDLPARQIRYRRTTRLHTPDGQVFEHEYLRQTHPVSQGEVQGWLENAGFHILSLFGDRQGHLYTAASSRAIFWAKKTA